jgi:hypothetical protein
MKQVVSCEVKVDFQLLHGELPLWENILETAHIQPSVVVTT